MSDPRRLLEDLSASDPAGKLLRAGLEVAPPAAARAAVWGKLEAALGPALTDPSSSGGPARSGAPSAPSPPPTTSGSSVSLGARGGLAAHGSAASGGTAVASLAPKASLGLGLGAKLGVGLVVLGGTVGGGYALVGGPGSSRPAPSVFQIEVGAARVDSQSEDGAVEARPIRASSASSLEGVAPPEAPAAESNPTDKAPVAENTHPKGPLSSSAPAMQSGLPPLDRKSQLLRESAGIREAREALASGNATGALAILGELDVLVRSGALGQERAVLRVEALAKAGRADQARSMAQAFLEKNPGSPYANRLRPYAN